jgi:hypothetical protein
MRLTDGYIFSLEGIEVYKNWVFTFFILKWINEKSLERVGPKPQVFFSLSIGRCFPQLKWDILLYSKDFTL